MHPYYQRFVARDIYSTSVICYDRLKLHLQVAMDDARFNLSLPHLKISECDLSNYEEITINSCEIVDTATDCLVKVRV